MKILKASTNAKLCHIPTGFVEGEPRATPLCWGATVQDFGILVEGQVNCPRCVESLLLIIEEGEVTYRESTDYQERTRIYQQLTMLRQLRREALQHISTERIVQHA